MLEKKSRFLFVISSFGETKIRAYLAVFLREEAHLIGDFRSDGLRHGLAVDYGGHLIGGG